MASALYSTTQGSTDLVRLAKIIFGPCTHVLRDILANEISPSMFLNKVNAFLAKNKRSLINKEQEKLLYGGDYSKFDISLLYFALRNMCSFPPHTNQWGHDPCPADRSISANIERLRLVRNQFVHDSTTIVADFQKKWKELLDIVMDLEKYLGTSTVYQDEVVEIKSCCMDSATESKYLEKLRAMNEKLLIIDGRYTKISKNLIKFTFRCEY